MKSYLRTRMPYNRSPGLTWVGSQPDIFSVATLERWIVLIMSANSFI